MGTRRRRDGEKDCLVMKSKKPGSRKSGQGNCHSKMHKLKAGLNSTQCLRVVDVLWSAVTCGRMQSIPKKDYNPIPKVQNKLQNR